MNFDEWRKGALKLNSQKPGDTSGSGKTISFDEWKNSGRSSGKSYRDIQKNAQKQYNVLKKYSDFSSKYNTWIKDTSNYLSRDEGTAPSTLPFAKSSGNTVKSATALKFDMGVDRNLSSKKKWNDIATPDKLKKDAADIVGDAGKLLKMLEQDKGYMTEEGYQSYKRYLEDISKGNLANVGSLIENESAFRNSFSTETAYRNAVILQRKNNRLGINADTTSADLISSLDNNNLTPEDREYLEGLANSKEFVLTMTPKEVQAKVDERYDALHSLSSQIGKLNKKITRLSRSGGKSEELNKARESRSKLQDKYGRLKKQLDSEYAYYDEYGNPVTWEEYLEIRNAESDIEKIKASNDYDIHRAYYVISGNSRGLALHDTVVKNVNTGKDKKTIEYYEDIRGGKTITNDDREAAIKTLTDAGYDPYQIIAYLNYNEAKKEDYDRRKKYSEWAGKNFGTGVLSTLMGLAAAPLQVVEYAGNIFKGNGGELERRKNVYNDVVGSSIEAYNTGVTKAIDDAIGNNALSWLATTAYSGVTSFTQSAATGLVASAIFGPNVGSTIALATLGSQAASSAYNQAIKNGSTYGEALAFSIASGLNEAVMEKLPLDNLLKNTSKFSKEAVATSLKQALKNTAYQGLLEGGEELGTAFLNAIADEIINSDKSQYNADIDRYMRTEGLSRDEAEKKANKDFLMGVLESVVGGFIGGVAGAGNIEIGKAVNRGVTDLKERTYAGQELLELHRGADALANEVMNELGIDRETYSALFEKAEKLSQAKTNKKGEYSGRTARLAEKTWREAYFAKNETGRKSRTEIIKNKLESKGIGAERSTEIAEEINSSFAIEEATETLKSKYTEDAAVLSTIDELTDPKNENHDTSLFDSVDEEKKAIMSLAMGRAHFDTKYAEDGGRVDEEKTELGEIVRFEEIKNEDGDSVSLPVIKVGERDVSLSDIELSAESIYRYANEKNSVESANEMIGAYKKLGGGINADTFAKEWNYAYQMGWANRNGTHTEFLSHDFTIPREAAENARAFGERETRKGLTEQKKDIKKAQRRKTGREGTISTEAVQNKKLITEGIERISKILNLAGYNIRLFEDTRENADRGSYEWDTNTINLNVAVGSGRGAIDLLLGRTLSHEITHSIQRWNPDGYGELKSFVREKMGDSFEGMVARRMKGLGLERADAIDEVIAYSCEMMLKNSKALTEFAKEHKRLFEKICDAVWDFIKKIRNALSELYGADTAFHEEARFMELYADELQEVFDRVLSKTLDISESTVNHDLQSNANKKTAENGGKVQKSAAIIPEYNESTETNYRRTSNNTTLNESDLEDYMKVGATLHTRNKKKRMLEAGKKPILTTPFETEQFIINVINGQAPGEVRAFGKVGGRLADSIKTKLNSLDLYGKYLELNADDLREAYKRHSSPKEKGDIALTEEDFKNIPKYLMDFDSIIAVNKYNGRVEIHIAKGTDDGYVRILTVSSKERDSLIVRKLIGVSKEKFEEKYAKKERDTGSPRGLSDKTEDSNPSTTARLTASALSSNSIPEISEKSKGKVQKSVAENSALEQEQIEEYRKARNISLTEALKLTATTEEEIQQIEKYEAKEEALNQKRKERADLENQKAEFIQKELSVATAEELELATSVAAKTRKALKTLERVHKRLSDRQTGLKSILNDKGATEDAKNKAFEEFDRNEKALENNERETFALEKVLTQNEAKINKSSKAQKLKEFNKEIKALDNSIKRGDQMLLELRSTDVFKMLLQKEKAYARAMGAEIMKKLMESSAERREKTVLIKKALDGARSIEEMAARQTASMHIPSSLATTIEAFSKAFPGREVDYDRRIEMLEARIYDAREQIRKLKEKQKNSDDKTYRILQAEINELILQKQKDQERLAKNKLWRDSAADLAKGLASYYSSLDKKKDVYDPALLEEARSIAELFHDNAGNARSINSLTKDELRKLCQTIAKIKRAIKDAKKVYRESRTLEQEGEQTISATEALTDKDYGKSNRLLKKFKFSIMKPYMLFKTTGSETLYRRFKKLHACEGIWGRDVDEATDVFQAAAKKYSITQARLDKEHSFVLDDGREIILSINEAMSIYLTALRDEGKLHLLGGGFKLERGLIKVPKDKYKIKRNAGESDADFEKRKGEVREACSKAIRWKETADPIRLTENDINKISAAILIDSNLKGFADTLQSYMSVELAAKGNETSKELYDVKLFLEKHYFPLLTEKAFLKINIDKAMGEIQIIHKGFTKQTKPDAANPLVIGNMAEVFARHANEMALYHAFAVELENMKKILNYGYITEDGKYKSVMSNLGEDLSNEIINYIREVNGGVRSESYNILDKIISLDKASKVGASLSVWVQQPFAILRAMAMISPKYIQPIHKGGIGEKHFRNKWAEMEKYTSTAIIKRLGGFDTNTSGAAIEAITDFGTWRGNGIARSLVKTAKKAGFIPAELLDRAAWIVLWNACKRESIDIYKNLSTEELLKKAGERFDEIVNSTQVYDSVFSRSKIMRSKNPLHKMAGAFMAEPLTSVNMGMDAINDFKSHRFKQCFRKITSLAITSLLTSAVVSLIYAERDDDEDESFYEKWLEAFHERAINDLINVPQYLPYLRDIWSAKEGYDVKRTDVSLIGDIISSVEDLIEIALEEDNEVKYQKLNKKSKFLLGKLGDFSGIPLTNLVREIEASWFTYNNDKKSTGQGVKEAVLTGLSKAFAFDMFYDEPSGSDCDKLYRAIKSDDSERYNQIANRLRGEGKTLNQIKSLIVDGIKANDKRVSEAATLKFNGKTADANKIVSQIVKDGFAEDLVTRAVDSVLNNMLKKPPEDDEYGIPVPSESEEFFTIYDAYDIYINLEDGDLEEAQIAIDDIYENKYAKALAELKDDEDEGDAERKALSSLRNMISGKYRDIYKASDEAERERIRELLLDIHVNGEQLYKEKTIDGWGEDD